MNKAKLKSYAPQARKDFIAAVEARAHSLGLSERAGTLDITPSEKKGDVTLIAGQAWPAKVHDQRQRLIKRMKKDGFAQTVEAVAYTWFNRFAALRYMEIHDYLDHGYRVLSSREGGLPEIIAHATDVAGNLPGLNASQIADMKLASNQDGELYRLLLVAQCNALSKAMPFLFEHIDDESELLLPGNLERTDSVVAKLVESIAENDWSEVEVIGWLYQFYISEKKDAVIGKVVKSEDIPAATQLFTPNWIVQYLVQNSVGRLWLMANPASTLKGNWRYYIEPAEQTPEVQAQLDALIQARMAEDGGSLNPEAITVLDPACGSGHILVEAYEVLKAIYLERGYQARAIPRLILEKNLFGLDIDDRAAQMAGFALMMKARADDRRLLDSPIKLNVLSLQESKGLDADELARALETVNRVSPPGVTRQTTSGFAGNELFPETQPQMNLDDSVKTGTSEDAAISRPTIALLIKTFAHAKTFGSLIQIPEALEKGLPALTAGLEKAMQSGDVFTQAAAQDLSPLVGQATVLAMMFDAVVANPPYMGSKFYDGLLKRFVDSHYSTAKGDLYTCFIVRNTQFGKKGGVVGMITIPNWMFLSGFENLRDWLFREAAIETFSHNGRGVFGSDFGSCAFTFRRHEAPNYKGQYKRLFDKHGSVAGNAELENRFGLAIPFNVSTSDFRKIPGCPVAYWVSDRVRKIYEQNPAIEDESPPKTGMSTGQNEKYILRWYEVDFLALGIGQSGRDAAHKYYPHNKGGEFKKWYGNQLDVLKYSDTDIAEMESEEGFRHDNAKLYFLPSISWTKVTSSHFNARWYPAGFTFNSASVAIFPSNTEFMLGYLNSNVFAHLSRAVSQTLNFTVGEIAKLPVIKFSSTTHENLVREVISISQQDWDSHELSWCFSSLRLSLASTQSLAESWGSLRIDSLYKFSRTMELERENNRIFIETYALQSELNPEVAEDQITLTRADREKDCQRLISYAVGCMMGRYSLDNPGLIYAHTGNIGFDPIRYKIFPADADGIVPISDELWFEDDASNRVREFLNAVWGVATLEENMAWLAESLGKKGAETSEEIIRRYLSGSFYKDHLQTYKKRPIYWHFSSGKQGAFQALVYLHRYHEGTLARMRAEYVVPLTGKMQSRIEMLEKDRDAASATAARTKIAKQIESLKKKHVELLVYDEKLRHYADMRIQLDLDDGVKVNYGKFGDLLAEVKAVTGGAGDE